MQENVKNGISTRDCGKIEADKRTRLGGGGKEAVLCYVCVDGSVTICRDLAEQANFPLTNNQTQIAGNAFDIRSIPEFYGVSTDHTGLNDWSN